MGGGEGGVQECVWKGGEYAEPQLFISVSVSACAWDLEITVVYVAGILWMRP